MISDDLNSSLRKKYTEISKSSLIRVQYSCSGNSSLFEETDYVSYRAATEEDFSEIVCILNECELNYSDLIPNKYYFEVAEIDHKVVGCVGVEMYDNNGLLRSLAVKPLYRGLGIGVKITDRIIDLAKSQGVDQLFLLTNTADKFFGANSWELINRNDVPEAIANTSQFKILCPSTSICMKYQLFR